MSFDIAIIVSDVSHANNFESFAHTLGIAVEKEGEVPFKDSTTNWQKGFVDVLFSPQGTLICGPLREYNVAAASQASQVALLSISKNSMIFNLECAENGSMKRIYTESDGTIRRNVKSPLIWENENKDYNQILSDCVKAFTGKGLKDYENGIAMRYGIIR